MTSLYNIAETQKRVIGALLIREIITRYGRKNLGFLWLFVEPILFTLGVTGLWVATGHKYGNTNISVIAFSLTGYSTLLMWRNCANRCGTALEPNKPLLHHRQVKPLDLFISRILLETLGATASFMCLMVGFTVIGIIEPPQNMILLIAGWMSLIWFSAGLGLFIGALITLSESFGRVWNAMTYIAFPLSGSVFMVEWLPKKIQRAATMIPTVNITEMIRHGYYGETIKTHESIEYIIQFNLLISFIGLATITSAIKLKSRHG